MDDVVERLRERANRMLKKGAKLSVREVRALLDALRSDPEALKAILGGPVVMVRGDVLIHAAKYYVGFRGDVEKDLRDIRDRVTPDKTYILYALPEERDDEPLAG